MVKATIGGHNHNPSDIKANVYDNISNTKRYQIYVTKCNGKDSFGKHFKGGYYNGYVVCLSIKEKAP